MSGSRERLAPGVTTARLSSGPEISVVIASCRSRELLDASIGSLLPQCEAHRAELVVARAADEREIEALRAAYPNVYFVTCSRESTIPHLRSAGMAATSGDIVALTEDHCIAAPDWLDQLTTARKGGSDVMGGAMDNAQRRRAVDWGAFFSEYGFFAENSPANSGPMPLLTGANVAYSRAVIDDVVQWAREGDWENVAHARLGARGSSLQFVRTAAVYQNQNYSLSAFCRDRYEHGRDYARRRLEEETTRSRIIYLVGSAILPFLLTARVARAVGSRHRGPFVRALPFTFTFLSAWSVGEIVGYWLGPVPSGQHE